MAKKVYKRGNWRGSVPSDAAAHIIGTELDRLFPDGEFTPEDVLKAAETKSSPLHPYFQWDDSKAAHEFRLYQARSIIRAIIVVIDDHEVPKFHRVHIGGENSYVDIQTAQSVPDLWDQVLENAMKELIRWKERYQNLKELTPIYSAITQTQRRLYGQERKAGKSGKSRSEK